MAKRPLFLAVIMHNRLAVRLLLAKDSVNPTIQDSREHARRLRAARENSGDDKGSAKKKGASLIKSIPKPDGPPKTWEYWLVCVMHSRMPKTQLLK